MSAELDAYKQQVETQQEKLLEYLARIGLTSQFDAKLPDPDPDAPLAEVMMAARLVGENLESLARERDAHLRQLQEKLSTIELQTKAMIELSTPVIQVWDEILILPLIGTVDTARAQQIMEGLLDTVEKTHCSVAIIDITGVPLVDTKVANHLLRTIEAVRLLGAEALLTGVSPHIAQTLVQLRVDLSRVSTLGSLQAGLRRAFVLTGRTVHQEESPSAGSLDDLG